MGGMFGCLSVDSKEDRVNCACMSHSPSPAFPTRSVVFEGVTELLERSTILSCFARLLDKIAWRNYVFPTKCWLFAFLHVLYVEVGQKKAVVSTSIGLLIHKRVVDLVIVRSLF